MNKNKNIKIIKNNIEKIRPISKNKNIKKHITDEQKQKIKYYQIQYRENKTDE